MSWIRLRAEPNVMMLTTSNNNYLINLMHYWVQVYNFNMLLHHLFISKMRHQFLIRWIRILLLTLKWRIKKTSKYSNKTEKNLVITMTLKTLTTKTIKTKIYWKRNNVKRYNLNFNLVKSLKMRAISCSIVFKKMKTAKFINNILKHLTKRPLTMKRTMIRFEYKIIRSGKINKLIKMQWNNRMT